MPTLTAGNSVTISIAGGETYSVVSVHNTNFRATFTPVNPATNPAGNSRSLGPLATATLLGPFGVAGTLVISVEPIPAVGSLDYVLAASSGLTPAAAAAAQTTFGGVVTDATPSESAVRVISKPAYLLAKFPLKSTLVASQYSGSDSTVTFSRNNAGTNGFTTVRDHLGNLNYCRTDEATFRGARRVENLFQDSSQLVTGWTLEGSTTRTNAANGQGKRYDRATASATMNSYASLTLEPGIHTVSFYAWVETGTVTIRVRIERNDTTLVATQDIALSTTTKRIGLSGLIPDTAQTSRVIIGIPSGTSVHFCMGSAQFEYKPDGTRHPSEYVARGVAGAAYPFAGAGVDGVKYFETLNPCFLETSATVRTDATPGGYPIAEATLTGLQRSPLAVQRLLYSSTFDNAAWVKTGVTATQTFVQNPVGYGRAYRLDETAVTSEMKVVGAWALTVLADNLNLAASCWVKKGVNREWCRIAITNKANVTDMVWFNLSTGNVGTITSNTGTVTDAEVVVEPYPNGWYRVGFGGMSAGTGATTPSATIAIADLDGNQSYAGVAGNNILVAGAQLETNDHPTAYIGNTAGSVIQRSGEVQLEVPITSNVPTNNFTVGVSFTPSYKLASTRKSAFYFIAYSYFDSINRWGTAIRPGVFGGNAVDQNSGAWAYDYYPNSASFGGTNITIGLLPTPFSTVDQLFGQSSAPIQLNGDGGFMAANGIVSYSTSTATPTVAPIENKQSYIRLGSSQVVGKHDASYKNLVFLNRVVSRYELQNPGSYA